MRKPDCLVIALAVALAPGCKRDSDNVPQNKVNIEAGLRKNIPVLDRTLTEIYLRNLDLGFKASPGAVPKTVEELEKIHGDRKLTKSIEEGQITVILGVNPERQPSDAILAYQTEPDKGGERVVLTCGGQILVMDNSKFEAAPKARAK
jgi:hypothetical protein